MDSKELMKVLDIDSKIDRKLNRSKYTPKTPKSGRSKKNKKQSIIEDKAIVGIIKDEKSP